MNETVVPESEPEPWFIPNDLAMRLLGVRASRYWGLAKRGRSRSLERGEGRKPSIRPSRHTRKGCWPKPFERHKVVILARLTRPVEIGRAGAQQAMVDAIALQVHQFPAGSV